MSTLKEIVHSMRVEPELLEVLSDEQKEIIFRKIREEQVRRWKKKEKELGEVPVRTTAQIKVKFLNGADNAPWVWVMGEHKDDLSYEQLVREKEKEKQEQERKSEIIEAKTLALQEISLLQGFDDLSVSKVETGAIPESPEMGIVRTESQIDATSQKKSGSRSMARKLSMRNARAAMGTTAEQKKKFEDERVEEVLGTLRRSKSVAIKRAKQLEQKNEMFWKESKRRAEMFERSRRRSFAVAKSMTEKTPNIHEKILADLTLLRKKEVEEEKKKPSRAAPPPPDKRRVLKMSSFVEKDSVPKLAVNVVRWFNTVEAPKGVGKECDGTISVWFHGKIGREATSKLLEKEVFGSYLVRLSAKLWGYTISVKSHIGTCHFLVDASSGHYHFLGPKQHKFQTLQALLEYYKTNPITWDGQEFLLIPVGLEDEREVYGGLYSDESDEDDGSTL